MPQKYHFNSLFFPLSFHNELRLCSYHLETITQPGKNKVHSKHVCVGVRELTVFIPVPVVRHTSTQSNHENKIDAASASWLQITLKTDYRTC